MLTSSEYDSRDLIELSDTEGDVSLFTVNGCEVDGYPTYRDWCT
jgi:hypothetical protein